MNNLILRTNQGGFTENLVQIDANATFATILAQVPAAQRAAFTECQNTITAGLPAFIAARLDATRRWWRNQCPRLLIRNRREHYIMFVNETLGTRTIQYVDERGAPQQIRSNQICNILDPEIVERQR